MEKFLEKAMKRFEEFRHDFLGGNEPGVMDNAREIHSKGLWSNPTRD